MVESPKSFIKKLTEYPSFLLLGQDYLKTNDGEDLFLTSLLKKYWNDFNGDDKLNHKNYDLIFETGINQHIDESFSWLFKLSKRLTPPHKFESVLKIPWSAVYTTSIDTILLDSFQNDWRQPQPIYNEDQVTQDPRNRFELHVNYLFGCINQEEDSKRIPLTPLEKQTRLNKANAWLQKLPELLTTRGTICIEGYNPNYDWLDISVLYSILDSLNERQAYFFSFKEQYKENDFINDLIKKEKIIPKKESLAAYLDQHLTEDDIDLAEIESDSLYGKWLNIAGNRKRVPKEIKSRLIKSAVILDDTLTLPKKLDSKENRYREFKKFLAHGSTQPYWRGYGNDFAFKRSFVVEISKLIKSLLEKNTQVEEPIINYGQSSSGKTIGLGHLGYYLASELKFPVLFIPRNFSNPDDIDLDTFCEWAESKGADFTFIIWDGMIEEDNYYKLLKRLNARGRKVIVIGSSYKKKATSSLENYKKLNYVEAKIELDEGEQRRFKNYLNENLPENKFLEDILKKSGEKNFLALLYRYLPETKRNIQEGLTTEVNKFSEFIIENATKKSNFKSQTRLASLLNEAGLVEDAKLDKQIEVEKEKLDVREQFIQYIMIPGQFGLTIPFELLLRCLGAEVFNSSLFEQLRKTDIVNWSEDKIGNIFIGPRTAIEAEIIAKSLGSHKAKIEIIKNLLSNIKTDLNRIQVSSRRDPVEIDFAVQLLQRVGPNSNLDFKSEYLLEITNVLEKLRSSRKAYHPRLVLQEASYLREIAKNDRENSNELLNKSEELLHEEIEKIETGSTSYIKTYFQVELASTLGTKVNKLLREDTIKKEEVIKYYNLAKQQVLSSKEENPENYPALDVLLWTTRDLIKSNVLNDEELIKIEADLYHLIDFVEQEGIGENYKEDFQQRKLEIGESLNNKEISEDAFEKLKEQDSAAGFFIKARNMLGDNTDINMKNPPTANQLDNLRNAFHYLEKNYDRISNDGRSVYFMFRLWWLIASKKPLFYDEKLTIPFSQKEWRKCLEFTIHLSNIDNIYETPTILYQRALSFFHLEHYKKASDTFSLISSKSDYSTVYGSRRIKKHHIASNEDGSIKNYSGEAAYSIQRSDQQRKGHIYIHEIRQRVVYMLNDFKLREVQEGRRFNDLAIAFNFRGPIAIPSNFLKE